MARIRTIHRPPTIGLSLSGRLSAADVGRLEHACRQALTANPISVEIDLRKVTDVDETAAAFLDRLVARGAVVIRGPVISDVRTYGQSRATDQ